MTQRPTLDDVRAQLRSRGYLQGALSLWIATGRGGSASTLRHALSAGARVGLVGGPVLAVPAAAALTLSGGAEPAARPLIQIWLVLSVLMGAALALLEGAVDFLLAWLARRGVILLGRAERLAGRVGLLFAGAATLYLLMYVRGGRLSGAAMASGGAPGWLRWGAVLLGALGAGHVIGRLTRLRTLVAIATSIAGFPIPGGEGSPPRRRPGVILAGWLLAVAAGAAMVFLPFRSGESPQAGPPPPVVAQPTPGRVLLLAVDGLDADLLDSATRGDPTGALSRLVAGGARRDLLSSEPPAPPVRWTTVATGRPASEHGVLGYQAGHLPGLAAPVQEPAVVSRWSLSPRLLLPPRVTSTVPVSSRERRARAVWEILGSHGITAAALNWWATWPAPSHGAPLAIVVSDRAFARLQAGRPPERDTAPPEFQENLRARFPEDLAAARRRLREAGLPERGAAAAGVLADAWHGRVGLRLWRNGDARMVLVYLSGLDIARRSEPGRAPLVLAALAPVLDEAMSVAGPEDLVLVAGDPGRTSRSEPAGRARRGSPGVLLAWGRRIGPGLAGSPIPLPPASLEDIAPTLLALAGLPPALDLPGHAVLDFLTSHDPALRTRAPIASYGAGPSIEDENAEDPFDEEVLDRLRSLGYIR